LIPMYPDACVVTAAARGMAHLEVREASVARTAAWVKASATVPGREWHRVAAAVICSWFARSRAPEPVVHRIHVFLGYLWWSLELADAACCLLVVAVRSGSCARAGPLGSFTVFLPLAQDLL
jgi:hypothetical protein